ncbi:hypothetical protein STTU_2038 [Streptomyces sp. Tu6071]|nr:hypothetical protein STTU_2038 [Streptomyces sp. Tu6071]
MVLPRAVAGTSPPRPVARLGPIRPACGARAARPTPMQLNEALLSSRPGP